MNAALLRKQRRGISGDWPFFLCLGLLGGTYVLLILAMLAADLAFTSQGHVLEALASPEIQFAIRLSLISCTVSTLLSLWVAVPLGYLLARTEFRARNCSTRSSTSPSCCRRLSSASAC